MDGYGRLTIVAAVLFTACGNGANNNSDTISPDTAASDVNAPDVNYSGYDIGPEALAGAMPIDEVDFLPTSEQKPEGKEPDLSPFFPDYCEQAPISPGMDPGCLTLSQQFNCKFINNPGPVGAWLKPSIAMLFCAVCEPGSDGKACECVGPAISTIPTADGGSLCLNAIIIEDGVLKKPELIDNREALLSRFLPIEDRGEALAFAFFEPDIRHLYTAAAFLQLEPGDDMGGITFECITDKVFGTLAFDSDPGFEVQTFRVAAPGSCPEHMIERVTLAVGSDGNISTSSSDLVCMDMSASCH